MVVALRGYAVKKPLEGESLPCNSCSQIDECKEPCGRLNALLPGVHNGKGRTENLTGLHSNTLQEKERIRRSDIFDQYQLWKDDFTKCQWIVVELYYRECMTEEQIAKKVGKARSTVNGLLNRAKRRKEIRGRQLRWETRDQMKKKSDNEIKT
jgi:predicted DNA-binding protein YlxM (UPF0122 family)